ncbi:hypothetical protein BAUCODRAFT_412032 [Baudoinia panamericana UAMH 10762]|uniref:Uncharacterized protein n=1 Tax=Baudoinia panamericana (strain UAMH 10762) TaxID=717646 RepID=M2N2C8_BAUPA|nr:uncharacterized protein BAUCODRAFT_412032 [Baudoinia panamericana UAMH 10762]EMC98068.1 hypothetical protein BAUCODRAFT_412032 [Baudoinia panamericana UAMH 10762]
MQEHGVSSCVMPCGLRQRQARGWLQKECDSLMRGERGEACARGSTDALQDNRVQRSTV